MAREEHKINEDFHLIYFFSPMELKDSEEILKEFKNAGCSGDNYFGAGNLSLASRLMAQRFSSFYLLFRNNEFCAGGGLLVKPKSLLFTRLYSRSGAAGIKYFVAHVFPFIFQEQKLLNKRYLLFSFNEGNRIEQSMHIKLNKFHEQSHAYLLWKKNISEFTKIEKKAVINDTIQTVYVRDLLNQPQQWLQENEWDSQNIASIQDEKVSTKKA